MRFVAVSDTHMAEVELPEGDVLLHAGDLTYQGSLPEVSTAARWLEDEKRKRGFRHVIVIAGNHDWLFQNEPNLARQLLRERGLVYVEDQGITIDGSSIRPGIAPGPGRITIYGSPWQPEFMNWAFNFPRGQALKDKWDLIPPGLDILLTHGPPHEILDGVGTPGPNQRHAGCEELRTAVERTKPKFHVFGHIHSGRGRLEQAGTVFINACVMNELYDPECQPWVFDLET